MKIDKLLFNNQHIKLIATLTNDISSQLITSQLLDAK